MVHAHPDDEALQTGGTIAAYATDGVNVCLVTCTNGELGEVADVPELGTREEIQARLGEVRLEELAEACRRLGPVDIRTLGYHDSGMEGTPSNADPKVFVKQDLEEVVGKIVRILREVRPQVLVTYNEYGFYGHPDHIRAHEAAMLAVDAAANADYSPDAGAPYQVAKVYYTAVPKSLLEQGRELSDQLSESDEELFTQEEIDRIGTDDDFVTTAIDVSAYLDQKFAALEAHRTQLGTTEWVLSMPPDVRALAFGTEYYVLARSMLRSREGTETDLFEGLE